MTIKIINKRLCAILFVFAITLLAPTLQAADKKDTPEDVMRAGKLASAEITRLIGELRQRAGNADAKTRADLNNQITALTRLQPLMSRLGQNRSFAAQVLDLSLKNDKPGLAALWEKEAAGCKFQIREIRDWWFYGVFEVDGHLYEVSAGSDTSFRITPLGRAKR
jgi:hypothetical protein